MKDEIINAGPENVAPEAAAEDVTPESAIPLQMRGIYLFMGEVCDSSIRPIIEWILTENLVSKRREFLQLFLSSPGGSCNASYALTDMMEASAVPVHTTGIGGCASAGLMILMAGAKGHRVITPNTKILSHQYSAGAVGKAHELIATGRMFELEAKRMYEHYRKHTGLSAAKIRKHLLPAEDKWYSAEEALKLKLVDEIKGL